jgi:hydroxymethylpyrimidine pyrophosphatase-like HAD family hydrolase
MDVLKIAKFAHKFCIAADGRRVEYPPAGADGNLLTNYADDGMSVRTFVQYHGPYKPERNAEIYDKCKAKSKSDKKCKKWLDQFEEASKRYLEDRNGGADFNDSMVDELLEECERYLEQDESDADGPCWSGYEMVGMKDKGGRQVPNCVPKS